MNHLKFIIGHTYHQEQPRIKIYLRQELQHECVFDSGEMDIDICVPSEPGKYSISIHHQSEIAPKQLEPDQAVEVRKAYLDDVPIPHWFLWNNCDFRFGDQHHQSLLISNGVWRLDFETPFITGLLDQKILHEAKYNQDYQYPWSYKIGPGQVDDLERDLLAAIELVKSKL